MYLNSSLLTWDLHRVTSFQGKQYRTGDGVSLLWRNWQSLPQTRWSRLTSTVISHVKVCSLDIMWCEGHFTFVVFFPKIHYPSIIVRKTDKFQLRDILQNTWPALSKTVRAIKNKESYRDCHNQIQSKEDMSTRYNVYPGWGPGTVKGH